MNPGMIDRIVTALVFATLAALCVAAGYYASEMIVPAVHHHYQQQQEANR